MTSSIKRCNTSGWTSTLVFSMSPNETGPRNCELCSVMATCDEHPRSRTKHLCVRHTLYHNKQHPLQAANGKGYLSAQSLMAMEAAGMDAGQMGNMGGGAANLGGVPEAVPETSGSVEHPSPMRDAKGRRRNQTKTERQQMLNKAAQQRCAAMLLVLLCYGFYRAESNSKGCKQRHKLFNPSLVSVQLSREEESESQRSQVGSIVPSRQSAGAVHGSCREE